MEGCDWNCSDLSIRRMCLFPSIHSRATTMSECTLKYRILNKNSLTSIHLSLHFQTNIVFPNMKPDPDNTIDAEKPGKFFWWLLVSLLSGKLPVKLRETPFLSIPGWKSISGCPRQSLPSIFTTKVKHLLGLGTAWIEVPNPSTCSVCYSLCRGISAPKSEPGGVKQPGLPQILLSSSSPNWRLLQAA